MRSRSPIAFVVAAALAAAAAIVISGRTDTSKSDPMSDGLAKADSVIRAWVDAGRVPGAVLSVMLNGHPPFERAYGRAQLDPPVPMDLKTVFDLASVTKVMATTFAVMLLVDRGRLDLDAPIHETLPDFQGGGKEHITARHLLTHRSGLHAWQPTYYAAADADGVYAYVRDLDLLSPAGEERRYSDLGFMLLGRMVEAISGQTLDRFVADEVYGPLGLTSIGYRRLGASSGGTARAPDFAATSHGNPFERRMVQDTTFGYRFEGDPDSWSQWRDYQLVGEVNDGNAYHAFGGVAGHAGLFSDVADLQVLLGLLLGSGIAVDREGQRLISPEIVREFLTDGGDNQALGWQVPDYAPQGSFTHTGFTGTWVLAVPSLGVRAVLLTNRQNGGVDAETRYPDLAALQRAVGEAVVRASRLGNPT